LHGFPNAGSANADADYAVSRRKILLLLGEKAGMREDVAQTGNVGDDVRSL